MLLLSSIQLEVIWRDLCDHLHCSVLVLVCLHTEHLCPGSGPRYLAVFRFPPFCRVAWLYGIVPVTHKIVNRDTHILCPATQMSYHPKFRFDCLTEPRLVCGSSCSRPAVWNSLEMGHKVHAACMHALCCDISFCSKEQRIHANILTGRQTGTRCGNTRIQNTSSWRLINRLPVWPVTTLLYTHCVLVYV